MPHSDTAHDDPLVSILGEPRKGAVLRDKAVKNLNERSPIYDRLARNEADQLRGYLLSRFADLGLAQEALPFIREELELGDSAYCAGGAARALAGLKEPPDWAAEALLCAAHRFMNADDTVVFSAKASERKGDATTTLTEIFVAIGRLGRDAGGILGALNTMAEHPMTQGASVALDAARVQIASHVPTCCGGTVQSQSDAALPSRPLDDPARLADTLMEDHQGRKARLGEVFDADVNVIAFFYTRCMNPAKCSATIETLSKLQHDLGDLAPRCRLGAISYEPAYDTPRRLSVYGGNRGIGPESAIRLLRPVDGIDPLKELLDLGVGFGETTINRHRSEVFLFDRNMQNVASIVRRKFTRDEALDLIRMELGKG